MNTIVNNRQQYQCNPMFHFEVLLTKNPMDDILNFESCSTNYCRPLPVCDLVSPVLSIDPAPLHNKVIKKIAS